MTEPGTGQPDNQGARRERTGPEIIMDAMAMGDIEDASQNPESVESAEQSTKTPEEIEALNAITHRSIVDRMSPLFWRDWQKRKASQEISGIESRIKQLHKELEFTRIGINADTRINDKKILAASRDVANLTIDVEIFEENLDSNELTDQAKLFAVSHLQLLRSQLENADANLKNAWSTATRHSKKTMYNETGEVVEVRKADWANFEYNQQILDLKLEKAKLEIKLFWLGRKKWPLDLSFRHDKNILLRLGSLLMKKKIAEYDLQKHNETNPGGSQNRTPAPSVTRRSQPPKTRAPQPPSSPDGDIPSFLQQDLDSDGIPLTFSTQDDEEKNSFDIDDITLDGSPSGLDRESVIETGKENITLESLPPLIGQQMWVLRSSGEWDDKWTVSGYYPPDSKGETYVNMTSVDPTNGDYLIKKILLEELLAWQTAEHGEKTQTGAEVERNKQIAEAIKTLETILSKKWVKDTIAIDEGIRALEKGQPVNPTDKLDYLMSQFKEATGEEWNKDFDIVAFAKRKKEALDQVEKNKGEPRLRETPEPTATSLGRTEEPIRVEQPSLSAVQEKMDANPGMTREEATRLLIGEALKKKETEIIPEDFKVGQEVRTPYEKDWLMWTIQSISQDKKIITLTRNTSDGTPKQSSVDSKWLRKSQIKYTDQQKKTANITSTESSQEADINPTPANKQESLPPPTIKETEIAPKSFRVGQEVKSETTPERFQDGDEVYLATDEEGNERIWIIKWFSNDNKTAYLHLKNPDGKTGMINKPVADLHLVLKESTEPDDIPLAPPEPDESTTITPTEGIEQAEPEARAEEEESSNYKEGDKIKAWQYTPGRGGFFEDAKITSINKIDGKTVVTFQTKTVGGQEIDYPTMDGWQKEWESKQNWATEKNGLRYQERDVIKDKLENDQFADAKIISIEKFSDGRVMARIALVNDPDQTLKIVDYHNELVKWQKEWDKKHPPETLSAKQEELPLSPSDVKSRLAEIETIESEKAKDKAYSMLALIIKNQIDNTPNDELRSQALEIISLIKNEKMRDQLKTILIIK
ncbi:hypothetical protein KJ836_03175 [Patescibacteria group bacterium]|nr:hypothetical protein [Patescibacteria group bacterium]